MSYMQNFARLQLLIISIFIQRSPHVAKTKEFALIDCCMGPDSNKAVVYTNIYVLQMLQTESIKFEKH